ncbi:MarR family winged helix-turn-helix transcriptional regulator [Pontibacter sp. G13]|uniref:MarR family winged helix-turn-helix transcriptional regulator n=1 Tax=Pontibacter sp. G13 TaxID=3074898 RepID=UPI00288BFF27|nr:MarR family winged helix-turn-helix transcriptional regulator [Pontibacter sp. G13]WNJ21584.1 MarR family winged helix-turn-helix transcriptional regulator [Pontibacter sp. G13]
MSKHKTLDFYIRKAWLSIFNMYNQQAGSRGYSISEAYVLLSIDREEGTLATHIGPLTGLKRGSLTRTLRDMEAQGMIYRKADPDDRRIRKVYLTEQGMTYRETAAEVVKDFDKVIQSSFSPEQLDTFREVLEGIERMAGERYEQQSKNVSPDRMTS